MAADTATLAILGDGFNPDSGRYEVAACAWSERHTEKACPYDLGRRGYAPRLLPVRDPDGGLALRDDGNPGLSVAESIPNLKRHVLDVLRGEADQIVAKARAEEKA